MAVVRSFLGSGVAPLVQTYEIQLSEPAEAEIDALVLRQARFSPEAASRLHEGLLSSLRSLSQMPGRCAFAPENGMFDREVRQLIYRQGKTIFRILFCIFEAREDEPAFVYILRVRHGAQQTLGLQTGREDDLA